MTEKSVSVLVVGAGPTGLMAACQLALRGISFRIIDKNFAPTTQSRAIILHARTLEVFEQLGIASKAVALSEPCHGVTWVFNGKEAATLKIKGKEQTRFPYILCLEQNKTEELLINYLEKLGHHVEWDTKLIHLSSEDKISAITKKEDGAEETIEADYVIGADGSHSIVREKMELELEGETYPQVLYLIDCHVEMNIRPHEIYLMMTEQGMTGLFPMAQSQDKMGNTRYRVLGILPQEYQEKTITFSEIQKNFSAQINMVAKIDDPAWVSVYHSHHRYAKMLRCGNYFIAGDAAHIHSPLGGQGMNTGIQDAYNLVWKLALVIQGKANETLLDTYNTERWAVAEKLVKTTDRIFYTVVSDKPGVKIFRLYIFPYVLRLISFFGRYFKIIGKSIFRKLSQIGIQYRGSALSQNASWGNFSKHAPQPGDRVPYVFFKQDNKRINIQDYLKGAAFHCFVFLTTNSDADNFFVPEKYKELMDVHFIFKTTDTQSIFKLFGIAQEGYYLIRPDMYIACRSASLDTNMLESYLRRFFIAENLDAAK